MINNLLNAAAFVQHTLVDAPSSSDSSIITRPRFVGTRPRFVGRGALGASALHVQRRPRLRGGGDAQLVWHGRDAERAARARVRVSYSDGSSLSMRGGM